MMVLLIRKACLFALDNGRFPVWSAGKEWDENLYWKLIEKASKVGYPPRWIAVPDVVANAKETFEEWYKWTEKLLPLKWPLALVVQDDMSVKQVKQLMPSPDIVFIGGTTKWKWRTLPTWTKNFNRVHVGRVNTENMLWTVHKAGAESSDGTGWWHKRQYMGLKRYLRKSSQGEIQGLIY